MAEASYLWRGTNISWLNRVKTAIKVIMASLRTNEKRSEINAGEDSVTYSLRLLLPPRPALECELDNEEKLISHGLMHNKHFNHVPKIMIETYIIGWMMYVQLICGYLFLKYLTDLKRSIRFYMLCKWLENICLVYRPAKVKSANRVRCHIN